MTEDWNQMLRLIAQIVKGMTLLESLSLELCLLTEVAGEIGESITHHKSLKNFHFNFAREYEDEFLTDTGISQFFDALKKASSLETVDLNLFQTSTGERTMKDLALALKEFRSLKDLYLNLNHCDGLDDKGMQYLFNNKHEFYELIKLQIEFSGLRITKKTVDSVIGLLKNMPCLQEISFWSESIDKKTIQEMKKAIKGLKDLRKITFRFNGLYRMTLEFRYEILSLGKNKKIQVNII